MNILIFSDLHVDCRPLQFNNLLSHKESIAIVAGDISSFNSPTFLPTIKELSYLVKYLLFTPGNHEYYGCDIITSKLKAIENLKQYPNVIFLDNTTFILDNVKFIGTTLWTDMNKNDWFAKHSAKNNMNDFHIIRNNGNVFTPDDSIELFNNNVSFIKDELELSKQDDNIYTNVVVTHHAPSYKSILPKYLHDSCNPAFASDLSELILNNNIKYWIHGHMHSFINYTIGDTNIICNPRGYNNKENPLFSTTYNVDIN
jgi:predicted phosphohydrolase